ncbi:hypothetical protein [Marinicella rhabdoformis]|uniref:hypothetical protein n=1 Tax=Marinicella rhabdoformis TaxID=2580566 RepID=UPI0012AEDF4E|nr:hypothetical protein [Marinicella rhabdoformis]
MRKESIDQQINADLTDYFEQARRQQCPPSMKQGLYQRIGVTKTKSTFMQTWFKPAMAFSFVTLATGGLLWQHHQDQKLLAAEQEMQLAMHYMQKISNKTLGDVNTHGIKPAIIVPLTKSMAKI